MDIGTSRYSNTGHTKGGLRHTRTMLCGGRCRTPPEPEIQGTWHCIAGDCWSSCNPQDQGCARARATTLSSKTDAASERWCIADITMVVYRPWIYDNRISVLVNNNIIFNTNVDITAVMVLRINIETNWYHGVKGLNNHTESARFPHTPRCPWAAIGHTIMVYTRPVSQPRPCLLTCEPHRGQVYTLPL